jgi:hypothetical protein
MAPALAIAAAQAAYGVGQSIFGGIARNKALKKIESLQTPTYTPNRGIGDFYQTALNRFNVDPFQSAEYKLAQTHADRASSNSINSMQDRRAALASISGIAAANNDAMLRANAAATNEQNQRFGVLGNATNMQASEDQKAFQFNKIAPYEKQYNLLANKASAASNTINSGAQNIFGGLSNGATMLGASGTTPSMSSGYSPFAPRGGNWNMALPYNDAKRPRALWE